MVRRAIEENWERAMREIPPSEEKRRMLEDMPGYQGAFNRLHYRYVPIASNPVLEWIAAEIEQHCTSREDIAAAFALRVGVMTRLIAQRLRAWLVGGKPRGAALEVWTGAEAYRAVWIDRNIRKR